MNSCFLLEPLTFLVCILTHRAFRVPPDAPRVASGVDPPDHLSFPSEPLESLLNRGSGLLLAAVSV